jgi:hypothetical protein
VFSPERPAGSLTQPRGKSVLPLCWPSNRLSRRLRTPPPVTLRNQFSKALDRHRHGPSMGEQHCCPSSWCKRWSIPPAGLDVLAVPIPSTARSRSSEPRPGNYDIDGLHGGHGDRKSVPGCARGCEWVEDRRVTARALRRLRQGGRPLRGTPHGMTGAAAVSLRRCRAAAIQLTIRGLHIDRLLAEASCREVCTRAVPS